MAAGRIDFKGRLSKNLNSSRDLGPKFNDLDILNATPKVTSKKRKKKKRIDGFFKKINMILKLK